MNQDSFIIECYSVDIKLIIHKVAVRSICLNNAQSVNYDVDTATAVVVVGCL